MKETEAKVGMRVKYGAPGRETIGTIVKIYPRYGYFDEDEDRWNFYPAHPAVEVDTAPTWWPYKHLDGTVVKVFHPRFSELQPYED